MKKPTTKDDRSRQSAREKQAAGAQPGGLEVLRSEMRYQKMIEEIEDYAIFLLDEKGNVLDWNEGAEKIKGYKREEIIGKNFRIFYRPEDRDQGLPETLIEKAKNEGKALHEGWRVRKDGSSFWGSILITALHDEQNRVIGFSKVSRDLTERRLAELKARQYARDLEFQNRELEQFVYVASHDLKEPLRKIQVYMSILTGERKMPLEDNGRRYLQKTMEAARRMQRLIDDLLAYSKATVHTEGREPIALKELVHTVVQSYTEDHEGPKVTAEIRELPVIAGIPFQVRQLVDNLIGNAVKYKHPDRDLMLRVGSSVVTETLEDDVEVKESKMYYRVSFDDNGLGFDNVHAKKIFEIFQRLHNQIDFSGSGIGLAICKKVMQNHGGFLRATGRPGEGARFDCYFPVGDAETTALT